MQLLSHHLPLCRRSPLLHEREGDEEAEGAQKQGGHLHAGHEPGGRLLGLVRQEVVPPHWSHLHVVRSSSVLHHGDPAFFLSCLRQSTFVFQAFCTFFVKHLQHADITPHTFLSLVCSCEAAVLLKLVSFLHFQQPLIVSGCGDPPCS